MVHPRLVQGKVLVPVKDYVIHIVEAVSTELDSAAMRPVLEILRKQRERRSGLVVVGGEKTRGGGGGVCVGGRAGLISRPHFAIACITFTHCKGSV